ncbi:MAG: O-phosphoserine--tRNA ligase [Candidatus Altiarchaeales archaeon WOR_SM1_86-2]|nr:MAG: O-phosphoserine--tRNA ligase [Candidatus Altiarchaeales archaeon WOR_SM1_86-2]
MVFDTKKIKSKAKENFEKSWIETANLLPKESKKDYLGGGGRGHIIQDAMQEVRKIFLKLGFDEVENPVFIPEQEIYFQYGPEAPVILDRCYYLAGLPRPDIGLGDEKIKEIEEIAPKFNFDEFRKILRQYRAGVIESDDLVEAMVNRINLRTEIASKIIDLFSEFREIEPVASRTTLRSHMTASWFSTIEAMQYKHELPMKLFSIGLRFRREQKVDETHLRAHYGASCIIMDDEISIDAGKKITSRVLGELGFKDVSFVRKKATSNYYAPETEYEVFSGKVEVADIGMYSPVALANYDIPYPVFNLGFGLERVLMIQKGLGDVRSVMYPQFYRDLKLEDEDITEYIEIDKTPVSDEGGKLAENIVEIAREHGDDPSPCKFLAYDGRLLGKHIKAYVTEKEDNTKLLGPAALNEVYVYDHSIYGVPPGIGEGMKNYNLLKEIKEKGTPGGFSYLDACANLFAHEIENAVKRNEKVGFWQIKMAKNPSDLNIVVGGIARRYISSKNKRIDLRGPVFMSVELMVE